MNGVLRSAVALLLLTSCSSAPPAAERKEAVVPHTPTATASAAPTPAPAVTLAAAGRALSDYLATEDAVRAGQDERMALKLARDAQLPLTIARYHASGSKLPRYTWGPRTLLVPRLRPGSVNRWFAALVQRGSPDGSSRTALLVFVAQKDGDEPGWQKAFETLLAPGAAPPKVTRDADGYATPLDMRDQSVAISPNLFGPLHATVAEEGTGGYASRLIAAGKWTTGYYPQILRERGAAKHDGIAYNSIFAAGTYPTYALRTDDGGALLLYTLIRTSTWTTAQSSGQAEGTTLAIGRPYAIPSDAKWALDDPEDVFLIDERRITATMQYAGLVPPKGSTAQAQVIGYDGFVTKATNTPDRGGKG